MFELRDITLNGTNQPRLDRVSVQFSDGWTAVVGASGAGKTSLLNILAGFEGADSGVLLNPQTTNQTSAAGARLPLYWVPQNGGLWPHVSARRHVELVSDADTATELLGRFDLMNRRDALPGDLSQGERSRLSLARAIATRAEWLLLDEPLSHVDPGRKPGWWKLVRELIDAAQSRVVFTSHEPETVLEQSDCIVCLHEGRVLFAGSTTDLYDRPTNRIAGEFLGPLNWLAADDARLFLLMDPSSAEVGIRPDWISFARADAGPLRLIASSSRGLCRVSAIQDEGSGRTLTLLHRPSDEHLQTGQAVAMRVLDSRVRGNEGRLSFPADTNQ